MAKARRANTGGGILRATASAALALGVTLVTPAAAPGAKATARDFATAYVRPASIPQAPENALTHERELLGRTLFFDPRLSGSNWISCASCHNPGFSWTDCLPKAMGDGMAELGRRTPSIMNLAWSETFFWDGRASSLEQQALGPITSPREMNLPADVMVTKLRSIPGYAPLFARAYPGEAIDETTTAKAIATFERSIVSAEAPFDRWVRGEESALGDDAKRGFLLFNTKADCAGCHATWRFTDDGFHDIGLPGSDRGRGAIVPNLEAVQFAFKTPSLRNVARRAPYMHDGSESTLGSVVDLYNDGGKVRRPSVAAEMHPLQMTRRERNDLLAFLGTLTAPDAEVAIPPLPR